MDHSSTRANETLTNVRNPQDHHAGSDGLDTRIAESSELNYFTKYNFIFKLRQRRKAFEHQETGGKGRGTARRGLRVKSESMGEECGLPGNRCVPCHPLPSYIKFPELTGTKNDERGGMDKGDASV